MPDLPTLSVTTDQANYLLGVFGSEEAYLQWLLDAIKGKVMEGEMREARAAAQESIAQRRAALLARLDTVQVPPA